MLRPWSYLESYSDRVIGENHGKTCAWPLQTHNLSAAKDWAQLLQAIDRKCEDMDDATAILSPEGEIVISFETAQGQEIRTAAVNVTRQKAVFELYDTRLPLRVSEVLPSFKITIGNLPVFVGRAVLSHLVSTNTQLVCEATLQDGWMDLDIFSLASRTQELPGYFAEFLRKWQGFYRVKSDFKLWVADVESFLFDLRTWAEQLEMGIRAAPSGDRIELEHAIVSALSPGVTECLNALFAKFEPIAAGIPQDQQAAHHAYIKRHLHPLVLCSPFAYRTFHKPLGYAGDYEMVNMLLRDPQEGSSVFAKLLNAWFISQPPAQAHRNRIRYLADRLTSVSLACRSQGRSARVFNLGCGPAQEIQDFLESPAADSANIVLLDFNDETLQYTTGVIDDRLKKFGRKTQIQFIKKSVIQILKGASRSTQGSPENSYDLVYCAGLFDYLPDRICKELMGLLYEMLAPGGLLLSTNVESSNPIRNMLDYLLEWHLIYRTGREMLAFTPDRANKDHVSVMSDETSVNVFLEVRKPMT